VQTDDHEGDPRVIRVEPARQTHSGGEKRERDSADDFGDEATSIASQVRCELHDAQNGDPGERYPERTASHPDDAQKRGGGS
jgi:hypothetical protein